MEFLQQNFLLVTLVFVSGGMLLWTTSQAGGSQLTPTDATILLNREDAIVIDVRSPSEYAAGHVPDSLNIPSANLGERFKELEKFKDRPLIVNCATGLRSGSACKTLRKLGAERVFSLSGGINAWAQAGLPVKKGSK